MKLSVFIKFAINFQAKITLLSLWNKEFPKHLLKTTNIASRDRGPIYEEIETKTGE